MNVTGRAVTGRGRNPKYRIVQHLAQVPRVVGYLEERMACFGCGDTLQSPLDEVMSCTHPLAACTVMQT